MAQEDLIVWQEYVGGRWVSREAEESKVRAALENLRRVDMRMAENVVVQWEEPFGDKWVTRSGPVSAVRALIEQWDGALSERFESVPMGSDQSDRLKLFVE